MNNHIVTLDVREEIRRGLEPCSKIMGAAAALKVGQSLLLLAPFEPVPLFGVLKQQGFRHTAKPLGAGDWEVLFTRESAGSIQESEAPAGASCSCGGSVADATEMVEIDARGLEPPQPMVKILEALAGLRPGAELAARTDRRPMHLYAQLENRGFVGETTEQADGSFLTHVRRR